MSAGRINRNLLAILAVSALLRVALALQGGQYFFGDEVRFNRGAVIYLGVRQGDWKKVGDCFLSPEHTGFTCISALLAPVQHALAWLAGSGDWSVARNVLSSATFSAALLALVSTGSVWLIYKLARATGAGKDEADLAALLGAASSTLFSYSRHLLPYDCALLAGLGSLLFSSTAATPRRQLLGGLLAGLGYEIYNGYWFMIPVCALALLLSHAGTGSRWRAASHWALGCGLAVGLLLLPGFLIGGSNYWRLLVGFSGSVTQGVFDEGWSLPWAYLWHAEGWLGLGLALAAAGAVVHSIRHRDLPPRIRLWLQLAAGLYAVLILASVGLHKFVVYARTVRPLVPLLCLISGYAVHRLAGFVPWRRRLACAVVVAGATVNFLPYFTLVFPRDVAEQTWLRYGITRTALSYRGLICQPPPGPVLRRDLVLVNAQALYPLKDYIGYPAGTEIFSVPHPDNLPALQYDGYTPEERALLRRHGAAIKLIRMTGTQPAEPPVISNQDRP